MQQKHKKSQLWFESNLSAYTANALPLELPDGAHCLCWNFTNPFPSTFLQRFSSSRFDHAIFSQLDVQVYSSYLRSDVNRDSWATSQMQWASGWTIKIWRTIDLRFVELVFWQSTCNYQFSTPWHGPWKMFYTTNPPSWSRRGLILVYSLCVYWFFSFLPMHWGTRTFFPEESLFNPCNAPIHTVLTAHKHQCLRGRQFPPSLFSLVQLVNPSGETSGPLLFVLIFFLQLCPFLFSVAVLKIKVLRILVLKITSDFHILVWKCEVSLAAWLPDGLAMKPKVAKKYRQVLGILFHWLWNQRFFPVVSFFYPCLAWVWEWKLTLLWIKQMRSCCASYPEDSGCASLPETEALHQRKLSGHGQFDVVSLSGTVRSRRRGKNGSEQLQPADFFLFHFKADLWTKAIDQFHESLMGIAVVIFHMLSIFMPMCMCAYTRMVYRGACG